MIVRDDLIHFQRVSDCEFYGMGCRAMMFLKFKDMLDLEMLLHTDDNLCAEPSWNICPMMYNIHVQLANIICFRYIIYLINISDFNVYICVTMCISI
jgi:hypothetical protein